MALHSTVDRVATVLVGNQSDTAGQGLDSSLAWDPHCQGGSQNTVVVPLRALEQGVQWEQVELGMVWEVLAGSMA